MSMKRKALAYSKGMWYTLTELLLYFPLFIVIHQFVFETTMWLSVLCILLFYIIGFAGGSSKYLMRIVYEFLFAIIIGVTIAIQLQGWNWQGWITALLAIVLILRGIQFSREPWISLFPAQYIFFGLLTYLFGVPVIGFYARELKPYLPVLNLFGICALVLFFYSMNLIQLNSAMLSTYSNNLPSVSAAVRRLNRLWVTGILLLIILIGFFPQLKAGAVGLFNMLKDFITNLLFGNHPGESINIPNQIEPSGRLLEPKEPSWFILLLEKILYGIVYTLGTLLAIALLYLFVTRVFPMLYRLFLKLLKRLQSHSAVSVAIGGFTDEQEQLVKWKELPGIWLKELVKRFARKENDMKWSQLPNNRERIRFMYRILIQQAGVKDYFFNKANTPDETEQDLVAQQIYPHNTAQTITSMYTRVRYGDLDISEKEMSKALEAAEPIKKVLLKQ